MDSHACRQPEINVVDHLVQELNDILAHLSPPITITTPRDLTPFLLISILESILRSRLPISAAIREAQTPASEVEAMKVFLGVLQYDILRVDIGLSEIDPRRLAAGEWDELIFVGETLCWIARHHPMRSSTEMAQDSAESSASGSNRYASDYTGFSRIDASESSVTTVRWQDHRSRENSPPPTGQVPRCIHEMDSSFSSETQSINLDAPEAFCDCSELSEAIGSKESSAADRMDDHGSSGPTRSSIRYEGCIAPADDDVLLFEALQERPRARNVTQASHRSNKNPRECHSLSTSEHLSSPHYTLSLLRERSRLLGELAKLKVEASQHLLTRTHTP